MTHYIKSLKDDFGAVGDGTTDDTTAIQNALDAGEALYIPPALSGYRFTSPLTITKVMEITGDSAASWLKGDFSTAQNGLTINLASGGARENGKLENFKVSSNTGRGLYIDLSSGSANYINRWVFNNLQVRNDSGSGNALELYNPTNTDGFFCSEITNCFFQGGVKMPRLGDSIIFHGNTVTGPGDGVNFDFVQGANMVEITSNNITSSGRAITVGTYALNTLIQQNNIEHVSGSTDYVILVEGSGSSSAGNQIKILDNSINGHSTVTGALVGIDNANDTLIDENRFMGGAQAIYNTATAARTRIGQRNVSTCSSFLFDQSTSTVIEGTGYTGGTTGGGDTEHDVSGKVGITKKSSASLIGHTSYSLSGLSIGSESTNRQAILTVTQYSTTTRTPTVVIGGITATLLASCAEGTYPQVKSYIYGVSLPTGTTTDISIDFGSGGSVDCGVTLYRLVNANTTAYATATDNTVSANLLTTTITVPADGGLIAVWQGQSTTSMVGTWTGVNKDNDTIFAHSGGFHGGSAGSQIYGTLQTSMTLSALIPATAIACSMAAVSFSHL